MAKAKPHARIEKLKSTPAIGRQPKSSWITRLPQEDQEELQEFRRQWAAGEFSDRTELSLFEYWQAELNLTIEKGAFFNWLKKRNVQEKA